MTFFIKPSFCTLLLLLNSLVFSQELLFDYLTVDDGLSHQSVNTIIRDNEGFMWFGTRYGLNRYDGYSFVQYFHNSDDSTSIVGDQIEGMIIDAEGNLWVATINGLSRFNKDKDNFTNYTFDEEDSTSLSANWVSTIYEDSKGRIWLGTIGGGVNLYNPAQDNFIRFMNNPDNPYSISSDNIRGIAEDRNNRIWFGTEQNGMVQYLEDYRFLRYTHDENDSKSLVHDWIYCVTSDKNGTIWIGTLGGGLSEVTADSDRNIYFNNYQPETSDFRRFKILTIMADNRDGIWLGTENGGLDYFNTNTKAFKNYHSDITKLNTLNSNSIHAIYEDDIGNFWIGTYTGSVNVIKKNKKRFRAYRNIPGNKNTISMNAVSCFFEDSAGNIWIGTDGGGANIWDRENNQIKHLNSETTSMQSDAVLAICEDKYHNVWISGWEVAFNKYLGNYNFKTYTQQDGLPNNNIFDMVLDRNNEMWVSFGGAGFGKFNHSTQSFDLYSLEDFNLTNLWITELDVNYSNNILLGHSYGFTIFNPENKTTITYSYDEDDTNSVSQNQVNSILVSSDSTVWLGTINGLNHFFPKENKFVRYFEEDGLPYNNIAALIEDDSNRIWISTGKGISVYNPKTKKFKNYKLSDGLQGNSFIRRSIYKLRSGEILMGGTDGFNVFHPDSLTDNKTIPAILITEFSIFNKPVTIGDGESILTKDISVTKEIALSYKQSVFSFKFVALDFTSPNENQYAYYLEGFEKDWNYVGTKREATYTNLDAGKYILHVKGSNNDGIWNEEGVSLTITITPPYWETWWFRISIFILIVLSLLSIYFLRINSIRKTNRILEQTVKDRTKELSKSNSLLLEQAEMLNETNTNLEERQQQIEEQAEELMAQKEELVEVNDALQKLNKTKDKFFSIIAHDIKNPFSTIMGFSEIFQKNFDRWTDEKKLQIADQIYSASKRLYELLENLLQWSRSQRGMIEFKPEKININDRISEVVLLFKDSAESKQINISTDFAKDGVLVRADHSMLSTILRNLISNAIKFTYPEGKIYIQTSINQSFITVSVKDTGTGMTKEVQKELFDLGSHRSKVGTNEEKGTGLGLILVQEFIVKHGGKIWLDSEPEKGSTFYFSLPLS